MKDNFFKFIKKKEIIFGIICLLVVCLGLSLVVSFSANSDEQQVVIKSIKPVYDDKTSVKNNANGFEHTVTFDDKNQNIKYYVVVENKADYSVKLIDIAKDTPKENFLKYEIENLSKNDVLESGESKEFVISVDTFKTEGWGRNFEDEIVTNLKFQKVKKSNSTIKNESSGEVIEKEEEKVEVDEDVDFDGTHNIEVDTEEDVKCPECKCEKNNCTIWKIAAVVFCIIAIIFAVILMVIFKKYKIAACIIIFISFGAFVPTMKAENVLLLPIKFNVVYDSITTLAAPKGQTSIIDYSIRSQAKRIYIENEIKDRNDCVKTFDLSMNQDGKIIACAVLNLDDSNYYDVYIQADGIINLNVDSSYLFNEMSYLELIDNMSGLDTSRVSNMSHMFDGTGRLSSNVEIDFSGFDTGNVTNMSYMFYNYALKSDDIKLDLKSFDTEKVVNMSDMFYNVGRNGNVELDISSFDTSNVTNMMQMFYNYGYNSTSLSLDLSNFNTKNVIVMTQMFSYVGKNSNDVELDISNFDTGNVTSMLGMFDSLAYNDVDFTLDVSHFDTKNLKNMSTMFRYTGYNSTTFELDVSGFDTSNVTSMEAAFCGTGYSNPNFTLDVSGFDTSKVSSMERMFNGTGYSNPNFNLDVSGFDTSSVTKVGYMFASTGFNSDKLDIVFTIKPAITSSPYYVDMFKNAATKEGSKITVNYTSANKDYIDKYIATKSENSNVVKGIQID